MPSLTKAHPASVEFNLENQGANLAFFTIDYVADVSAAARALPGGFLDTVYKLIQANATLVAIGPLFDTGSQQTFAVEALGGEFPTAAWDGSNVETWPAYLQRRIVALGNPYDTIDATAVTVAGTKLAIAYAAVVAP